MRYSPKLSNITVHEARQAAENDYTEELVTL